MTDPFVRAAIPALLVLACHAEAAPAANEATALSLTEVASVQLDSSLSLSGATFTEDGGVVAWSRRDGRVLWSSGLPAHWKVFNALCIPVAAAQIGGRIDIVDSVAPAILTLDMTGREIGRRALRVPVPLLGGAFANGTWFLTGLDSTSRFMVLRVDALDVTTIASYDAPPAPDTSMPPMIGGSIARYGDGVIIALRAAPFAVYVLNSAGEAVARSSLAAEGGPLAAVPETLVPRYWVSAAVVPTDRGWLQVLSDLRSQTRVLITFDATGAVVRSRLLEAPMSLVSSSPDAQLLLAARRLDVMELVQYRWRWRAPE